MDFEDVGVVIPAYNAEKTIGGLIEELVDYGFKRGNIIVINDGSKDRTCKAAEGGGVSVVNHKKNMGKGVSLRHGFDAAREKNLKKVFTLDADGQHRVSEITNFFNHEDRYDIIIGVRNSVVGMPFLRRVVNRTTSLVVSLFAKKYIPDAQSGFRCIDLKIFDEVRLKTNNYQTESELIVKTARHRYPIGFVPITTIYNNERSYIKPLIDTLKFMKMAIGFLWR